MKQRPLKTAGEQFGPDHQSVGTALNNLAALYKTIGRTENETNVRKRLARTPAPGTRHIQVYFATNRQRDNKISKDGQITFGADDANALAFGRAVMRNPILFGEIIRLLVVGTRPPHQRTPEFRPLKNKNGKTHWAYDKTLNPANVPVSVTQK